MSKVLRLSAAWTWRWREASRWNVVERVRGWARCETSAAARMVSFSAPMTRSDTSDERVAVDVEGSWENRGVRLCLSACETSGLSESTVSSEASTPQHHTSTCETDVVSRNWASLSSLGEWNRVAPFLARDDDSVAMIEACFAAPNADASSDSTESVSVAAEGQQASASFLTRSLFAPANRTVSTVASPPTVSAMSCFIFAYTSAHRSSNLALLTRTRTSTPSTRASASTSACAACPAARMRAARSHATRNLRRALALSTVNFNRLSA
mmetsp:Transcript_11456/g.36395  ORF Transcript_11456/g.36395 Transcript_11456/m.36395 type:complete len:268 (-) Transcript_11456:365-1168(-)